MGSRAGYSGAVQQSDTRSVCQGASWNDGVDMTDRELLEFAAKAAGIDAKWQDEEAADFDAEYLGMRVANRGYLNEYWNPINDDGDALRLACHLRINIEHVENSGRRPFGVNCWPLGRGDCGHIETDVTDYNAATRRAIVRAAAKIGRNMV